jgi:hypothetical protein
MEKGLLGKYPREKNMEDRDIRIMKKKTSYKSKNLQFPLLGVSGDKTFSNFSVTPLILGLFFSWDF